MFKFLKSYSEKIISISICILIIAAIGLYAVSLENKENMEKETIVSLEKAEDNREFIYVKIDGEVKNPGEYKLIKGARVGDAIEAAGGFSDNANEKINVGFILKDKETITVMKKDEPANAGIKYNININTATLDELTTFEGVGEKLAERIIQYRDKNGKFKTKEEIMNVKGIGKSFYEKFKEVIIIE